MMFLQTCLYRAAVYQCKFILIYRRNINARVQSGNFVTNRKLIGFNDMTEEEYNLTTTLI